MSWKARVAILAGLLALLGVAALITFPAGSRDVDVAELEERIRIEYEDELNAEAQEQNLSDVSVTSVRCVERDGRARCLADVDGGYRGREGIDVTIDEEGNYVWEADGTFLEPEPQ